MANDDIDQIAEWWKSRRFGALLADRDLLRAQLATAEQTIARLREALMETRELWTFAADQLDAYDRAAVRVPFMDLHDPIAKIDAALTPPEESK